MHSSTVLYLSALLLAANIVNAELERRATIYGWSCPGVLQVNKPEDGYCCIGGTVSIPPLTLSSCAGWPICTGPVTVTEPKTTTYPPLTCASVIPITAPDYSSRVSKASASMKASGFKPATTVTISDYDWRGWGNSISAVNVPSYSVNVPDISINAPYVSIDIPGFTASGDGGYVCTGDGCDNNDDNDNSASVTSTYTYTTTDASGSTITAAAVTTRPNSNTRTATATASSSTYSGAAAGGYVHSTGQSALIGGGLFAALGAFLL